MIRKPATRMALAACVALAVSFCAATASGPGVTNFRDGETVRQPVVMLAGTTGGQADANVVAVNESSRGPDRELTGLAADGRFKVLARLVAGENRLVVRIGQAETKLTLSYKPATSEYVVRAFYWTGKDGETDYQTPDANDPRDWRGKISTALLLLQCFTAQRLEDIGLGRKAFNLELDRAGRVEAHLLRGSKSAEAYRKMDGLALYREAGAELASQYPAEHVKNLVIPAFTRLDANTGKPVAHTALGGGDLALFGGADLFCWPDSLADAQAAFMDTRRIDRAKVFSDSVGRDTYWACASTTMGAVLHELGHCFGLPHSSDPQDIMSRGGDRLNRFFTLYEPPHARRACGYRFGSDQIARWAPMSGGALAASRYFQPDRRKWSNVNRLRIVADPNGQAVTIDAPDGLMYYGVGRLRTPDGLRVVQGWPTDPTVRSRTIAVKRIRQLAVEGTAIVEAVDAQGHAAQAVVDDLLAGPFVTRWRFASVCLSWPDPNEFPPVDADRLAEIEASAAKAKLSRSPRPFVDFGAQSCLGQRQRAAGYAMRKICSADARRIRLLTGSDDSLRMWLNGKQIAAIAGTRTAAMDSDTTTVDVRPGVNRLVVEVGQVGGGWGMMLRITDERGNKLELTDAGELRAVEKPKGK